MKAYKYYYNEETGSVDYVEFDIAFEFDFSHDPKTNIAETDGSHNVSLESTKQFVENVNYEIEVGLMKILKCKDCGRYYYLPKREESWFSDMDLVPPKRCQFCRGKKRSA